MDELVVGLDGLVERGWKISCVLDVGSSDLETRSKSVDDINNLENKERPQGMWPKSWPRKKMALQL